MDQTAASAGAGRIDPEFTAYPLRELAGAALERAAQLGAEHAHGDVSWVSDYQADPFGVSVAEKIALLAGWSSGLLADDRVDHVDASLLQVRECKFYSDGATTATQHRVRVHPELTAVAVQAGGRFETMRTLAPPAGRGYEYLTGTGWDFPAELAELPEHLAARLAAPAVRAGRYDLVIDPSNLFLTIHESIGHATELDRALGYEAACAGTSFATLDQLGSLRYGPPLMHVTGDRTARHGLATIGYDDEGVAAQSWDLISGGVLTGYQLDRRMARLKGFGASNGCAFADSPGHMPIQRMANVCLQPAQDGPSVDELIAGVEHGLRLRHPGRRTAGRAPPDAAQRSLAPGLECAPFVIAHASSRDSSVFDNGLPLAPTDWISGGELAGLTQTRHSAQRGAMAATPAIGNLILAAPDATASLDDMIARTERGLLLTCLWYIRPVDPQSLLVTGLTRDGVYLVEKGEVTAGVNNFRFSESPVAMLGRLAEAGATAATLPREWSDFFTRAAMPPVRVEGFNMSSVSQAS